MEIIPGVCRRNVTEQNLKESFPSSPGVIFEAKLTALGGAGRALVTRHEYVIAVGLNCDESGLSVPFTLPIEQVHPS